MLRGIISTGESLREGPRVDFYKLVFAIFQSLRPTRARRVLEDDYLVPPAAFTTASTTMRRFLLLAAAAATARGQLTEFSSYIVFDGFDVENFNRPNRLAHIELFGVLGRVFFAGEWIPENVRNTRSGSANARRTLSH